MRTALAVLVVSVLGGVRFQLLGKLPDGSYRIQASKLR
jgi:hypothetical protein